MNLPRNLSDQEREKLRHVLVIDDNKGQSKIVLEEATYSLGRSNHNSIILHSLSVSRSQAILIRLPIQDGDGFQFRLTDGDLSGNPSTNGTWVNGEKVTYRDLIHGDEIKMGRDVVAKYYILANLSDLEFHQSCEAEDLSVFFQVNNIPKNEIYKRSLPGSAANRDVVLTRLATFPELIPDPIVEITFEGAPTYINPAAKTIFPNLKELGAEHPFLKAALNVEHTAESSNVGREITIGKRCFYQTIQLIPNSELIRIFAQDITEQRKLEIDRDRRDRLLTDVIAAQDITFEERIRKLLTLGCEWFGFEVAAVFSLDPHHINVLDSCASSNGLSAYVNQQQWQWEPAKNRFQSLLEETIHQGFLAETLSYEDFGELLPVYTQGYWPDQSLRVLCSSIQWEESQGFLIFLKRIDANTTFIQFENRELIQIMSQWIGSEQERLSSQIQVRKQLQRTILMKYLVQQVHQSLDLNEIFAAIVHTLGLSLNVSRCVLYYFEDDEHLCVKSEFKFDEINSFLGQCVKLDSDEHLQQVLAADDAVPLDNVKAEYADNASYEPYYQAGIKSMLSVRISSKGKPMGVISLHECEIQRDWTLEETRFMEATATQISVAISHSLLMAQQKQTQKKIANRNKELNIARKKAEAGSLAKSQFLATMSHEIRTPMNAIIGMASLLKDTELSSQQKYLTETIHDAGETLLDIINNILDFSKIESGNLDLEATYYSPESVVNEVYQLLYHSVCEKNLELKVNLDKCLPHRIMGDRTRIRQILVNLVSNALKFTEQGMISIDVSCSGSQENTLWFRVQDTGVGISPEQQSTLFTSFRQGDASITRKYGGTGLGLAISRQLSELMGGTIWLTSQGHSAGNSPTNWLETTPSHVLDFFDHHHLPSDEMGTSFYFTITYESIPEKEVLAGQCCPLNSVSYTTSTQDCPKAISQEEAEQMLTFSSILVVEDNPVNQKVATLMLHKMGCQLDIAENGLEAIEAIEAKTYDLVLMDLEMPEMDGITATQEIIAKYPPELCPYIMAMTAYATEDILQKCLRSGMKDYLTKPFRVDDLSAKLTEIMGSKDFIPLSPSLRQHWPQEIESDEFESPWANENDIDLRDLELAQDMTSLDQSLEIDPLMDTEPQEIDATNLIQPDALIKPEPVESISFNQPIMNMSILDDIREMAGESAEEIIQQILQEYLEDTPSRIQSIQSAIEIADAEALRQAAHGLRSGSVNIGAEGVVEIASILEQKGRSQELLGAEDLLPQLKTAYQDIEKYIQREFLSSPTTESSELSPMPIASSNS